MKFPLVRDLAAETAGDGRFGRGAVGLIVAGDVADIELARESGVAHGEQQTEEQRRSSESHEKTPHRKVVRQL